jgi:hypothetical protein
VVGLALVPPVLKGVSVGGSDGGRGQGYSAQGLGQGQGQGQGQQPSSSPSFVALRQQLTVPMCQV